MDLGRRRSTTRTKSTGVVAGSVWESRMKLDEVRGGIKVFTDDSNSGETVVDCQPDGRLRAKQGAVSGASGRRKTWKSQSFDGFEKNPIQIAIEKSEVNEEDQSFDSIEENPTQMKTRSEVGNGDTILKSPIQKIKTGIEEVRDFSVSFDGVQKNPIQVRKLKSESCKDVGISNDTIPKSPIQKSKTGFEEARDFSVSFDGIQKNPIQIRKLKSETCKDVGVSNDTLPKSPIQKIKTGFEEARDFNLPIQNRKVKSESCKDVGESNDGTERNSIQIRKVKSENQRPSDESADGNQRNSIQQTESKPTLISDDPSRTLNRLGNGTEKNPIGIKKTRSDRTSNQHNMCQEKNVSSSLSSLDRTKSAPKFVVPDNDDCSSSGEEDWQELVEEIDKEIQVDIEKKSFNIKEFKLPRQRHKKVVSEVKRVHHQVQEKPFPPLFVNKPRGRSLFDIPKTTPIYVPNELPRTPQTYNKLQSLVDLIMWRDILQSAIVFGIGTFIIIVSSYYNNFNVSFITAVSCLGLVYLALIFLYRSFVCREDDGKDDMRQSIVIGEEDAIWLLKLVLPYFNEFLSKLKILFSGDPVTTMKMAVLLFVLASCANYMTTWKMAKLGFFGIFTVPKICSSYSTQLAASGTFWIKRCGAVWKSLSHKEAITFGIFIIVWNLSSFFVRIWALFVLSVALRHYQQSLAGGHKSWQGFGWTHK